MPTLTEIQAAYDKASSDLRAALDEVRLAREVAVYAIRELAVADEAAVVGRGSADEVDAAKAARDRAVSKLGVIEARLGQQGRA